MEFYQDIWQSDICYKREVELLKDKLKEWNRQVFGVLDLNVTKAIKLLNDLDDFIAENFVEVDSNLVAEQRSKVSNKVWET